MFHDQGSRSQIVAAGEITVDGLFRLSVRNHRDRVAIQHQGTTWTYAQLNERVNRTASYLLSLGVKRGDRVAVLAENRVETIELYLAAARLGVIVASQNWRLSRDEVVHCLTLVEPKVLLGSRRNEQLLQSLATAVPRTIFFDDEYEAGIAAADSRELPAVAEAEDGLLILYTSGTTGFPKGALISQRAMVFRSVVYYLDRKCERDDAFVAWTPLFHMASSDLTFGTLLQGGKVILMDGFDADALVETVAGERISHLSVVPGVVDRMIASLKSTGKRPLSVKTMGVMADLVPPDRIAEITSLVQAPFSNSFGSTETGSPPASKGLIPIGVAPTRLSKTQSSLCEIRLVDPERRDVPDGEPGEILVRSPTLFSGYWRASETNQADFRDGWFGMGDVFVRNPDGTLDFVDRRKYLIKSGGENIYPAEIERVLLSCEGVADAIVVRRVDAQWGEVPVAFVVTDKASLSPDELLKACRGKIASYKLPKEIRMVSADDLPRTVSGKIERRTLESRLRNENS